MKVAVVGAGISGLVAAYELAKSGVQVVVYEKEHYPGGHAKTVTLDGVDLDLDFMVLNQSNELFSLFLDETMTYSCAIFKSEDEDLKDAQLRKITRLIRKVIRQQTGCKYTGITLSEQQLKYAQLSSASRPSVSDQITFLLCDYRQIPNKDKYDRILSCGMLEHVEDGLLVVQFISIPDERYDEYRQISDFIKGYIFPDGCLPALSRVTSAMAAASRQCVEHLEEIGIHYYQTLQCWRKNFMKNKSQIRALGFDDKFIRTWEYYFDYCTAGFKTCTIGDYQIVFSRPGNVAVFGDAYNYTPLAYYKV
ncbi:hypothetical protein P3L10_011099 [Capsicum annuum]